MNNSSKANAFCQMSLSSVPFDVQCSVAGPGSETFKEMKMFNIVVKDYISKRTDALSMTLNKYLTHIYSQSDLDIFEPHNPIAAEFYVNLHNLMTCLLDAPETPGSLCLSAISVLERASSNGVARHALLNTFKFIPILTKLLCGIVGTDKRIRLLTLMQVLTYGIKITWQEPHLTQLISQLTKWVHTAPNEPLSTLSLSVLVNLCYKNVSAICIFTRNINLKEFAANTTMLRQEEKNIAIRVHLCKMMIILQYMSCSILKAELLNCLRIVVSSIEFAFISQDKTSLRNNVDFFNDLQTQTNIQGALNDYSNLVSDLTRLLDVIENNQRDNNPDATNRVESSQCMSLIFEFLSSVTQLNCPDVQPLYPRFVSVAFQWVNQEHASSQALGVLRNVVHRCSVEKRSSVVLEQLCLGFSSFSVSFEDQGALLENPQHVLALIQLIRTMLKHPTLQDQVLNCLKDTWVRTFFSPLFGHDKDERPHVYYNFKIEYISMYVHCLSLVAELAQINPKHWALSLIKMLRTTEVQSVIAHALVKGNTDLRENIFNLAKVRECEFPSKEVAKAVSDMEAVTVANDGSRNELKFCYMNNDFPSVSQSQNARLDALITKLDAAVSSNRIPNLVTSEVMEFYEFRLSTMSHTEQTNRRNLEYANNHITDLDHNIMLLSTEVSRLMGLLYTTQTSLERLAERDKDSSMRIAEFDNIIAESHKKLQIEREERIRTKNDLSQQMEAVENRLAAKVCELESLGAINSEMSKANKEMEDAKKGLSIALKSYEEQYNKCKSKLDEKDAVLNLSKRQVLELQKELYTVAEVSKRQDEKITECELQNARLKEENKELQQMRELIVSISTKKNNSSYNY